MHFWTDRRPRRLLISCSITAAKSSHLFPHMHLYTVKMYTTVASSNSSYAIVVCIPPDSLLLLLHSREPEVALTPLLERSTALPSVAEPARSLTIIQIWSDARILRQVTAPPSSGNNHDKWIWSDHVTAVSVSVSLPICSSTTQTGVRVRVTCWTNSAEARSSFSSPKCLARRFWLPFTLFSRAVHPYVGICQSWLQFIKSYLLSNIHFILQCFFMIKLYLVI